MEGFVAALGLERFAMSVFDYDAPIGFNLAIFHPMRQAGIKVLDVLSAAVALADYSEITLAIASLSGTRAPMLDMVR